MSSLPFEIVIESNIPIPTGRASYPFAKMEIGDSFCVPKEYRIKLASSAYTYAKNNGGKYTIRKMADGSARCYKIA